jgi:cytochrome P450
MGAPRFPDGEARFLGPDPLLHELRRQPIVRITAPYGGECWLVTRHEDVKAVQTDARFSREAIIGKDVARTSAFPLQGNSIIGMDPPDHTRIRRLVSAAFTARRVEHLRPAAQAMVDRLIDELVEGPQPADLVEGLATPLPIGMICDLLGVPFDDRVRFGAWARVFMTSSGHTMDEILDAHAKLLGYLTELVAERRAAPTSDLLGALVAQRDEGDALSEDELVQLGFTLLVGGYETTAAQLGKALFWLLLNPDDASRVRAEPELVGSAVEELLRMIPLSSGTSLAWVATEDVPVAGITVRAGEAVMASAAAANLDPSVFTDPERADVARDPNPHVAFGHGAHFCLGAHLARMEMQVAIETFLRRLPDARLAVEPDEVPWRPGSTVWGLAELPVRFGEG